MISNIATSTHGLVARMNVNTKNELKNYDEWVKELLIKYVNNPKKCLDVGCGVGKQTTLLHNLYPLSNITSIDKAQDSLDALADNLKSSRISLICADIDDVKKYCTSKYDLIISSYAFYYSRNMTDLLMQYNTYLEKDGVIILLGYSKRSNSELIQIINQTNKEKVPFYTDFMSAEEIFLLQNYFNVNISYFENKIGFNNISDFKSWFETSELFYKSENHSQVILDIQKILQNDDMFFLTKETLGIILKK